MLLRLFVGIILFTAGAAFLAPHPVLRLFIAHKRKP
jgi:hypothetical protein